MHRLSIVIAAAIATGGIFPRAALADRVPVQSPDKVEGACNEKGGVYFPSSATNATYGCLNKDGSGVVCGGGKTASDKNSCDTWPASMRVLPSRSQVRAYVAAAGKVKVGKPH